MNYLKTLVSLALLSGAIASSAAQATIMTYDIGTLGSDVTTKIGKPGAGMFTDYFNFTITIPSEVVVSVKNHAIPKNILDIAGLSMVLFNTNGTLGDMGDDIQIGPSLTSGESSLDILSSGNFYAMVTGNATGSQGGYYVIQMVADPLHLPVVASAVPLPGTVWLIGSGLLGLVGARRRRQA